MTTEIESDRRLLEDLPPSAKKARALEILAEMEGNEKRTDEILRKRELEFDIALGKLAPSPLAERIFRFLPWIAVILALVALYTGIDAIWNAEYCSRGRSGVVSCTHGVRARLEGGVAIAVAVFMAGIPIPSCRAKIVASWLVGLAGAGLLIASLLLR